MAMYGSAAPSLADIAAVTGNNQNDGFGGNGAWWVVIILFALFGGWGNGYNGNGGGGQGNYDTQASVQRGFDTQAIMNKLNGLENGICSLGYDQLAQMNGISNTVMQTGFGIQQAINADTVANMQNTNAIGRQIDGCCCENRAAIADLKYTMATDACALNNNVHQTGDAIINSQNNGFQMLNNTINQRFTQLEMAQKDQTIADLTAKLNKCDLDSALQGTASYILSYTNPRPEPAYIVQNPNCCQGPIPVTLQNNGCCNNGNWNNTCCNGNWVNG